MAPRYDTLAVTALRPDPAAPITRDYHLMTFPGRWKEPLHRLAQAHADRDQASIPIASPNKAITALVPDCVVTLPYVGRGQQDEDWLLAYHDVNPRAIYNLVAAWVRAHRASPEQIRATLAQLDATALTWSPVSINMSNIDLSNPDDQKRAMRLLPMDIAATLSRPESTCPYANLTFRRCPTATGAELMSWPPAGLQDKQPFSVTIGITAQTLPTSDEILIHLAFGLRRWMAGEGRLSADHGHSVYLSPTVPYLNGLHNSRHFTTAKIRRRPVTGQGPENVYAPQWDEQLANVLAQMGVLDKLPDPQQLKETPLEYLGRHEEPAALVYKTGMSSERVSAGLSPADRAPLMQWITTQLAPHLLPIDPLPRQKSPTVYKNIRGIDEGPLPITALDAALHTALPGGRLDIEILTGSTTTMQCALNRLATRLGQHLPSATELSGGEAQISLDTLDVRIRHVPAPTIRADLVNQERNPRRAVHERVEHIVATLGTTTHPTVCLVEIGGASAYEGLRRGKDPKYAIRHGLARSGRLSQLITPVTDTTGATQLDDGQPPSQSDQQRFNAAVDDLFRQLGIRPHALPEPARTTLPRPPALLAIWVIRQNKGRTWGTPRQLPVAVLIDPTGQTIQIKASGTEWHPLHSGLIEIARHYGETQPRCTSDDIMRFIHEALTKTTSCYPDTLLLTHAQNLRSARRGLSNKNLQLDTITLGADRQPIATYPGLRHVRVRGSIDGETAECYGVNGEIVGLPKGLWQLLPPRLFASTCEKPSTHTNALKGVSKLTAWEHGGTLRAAAPRAQIWNPQLVEILVAGLQEGDAPEHWATLTHDLRNTAPYVRDATTLPWPLHIAQQIDEYLLPTTIPTDRTEDTPIGE